MSFFDLILLSNPSGYGNDSFFEETVELLIIFDCEKRILIMIPLVTNACGIKVIFDYSMKFQKDFNVYFCLENQSCFCKVGMIGLLIL